MSAECSSEEVVMATLAPELVQHILAIVVLVYGGGVSLEDRLEYPFSDYEECEDIAAGTDYRGLISGFGYGPHTVEIKAGCIRDGIKISKGGEVAAGGEPFFEGGYGGMIFAGGEEFAIAGFAFGGGGGGGGGFSFGGFPSGGSSGGGGAGRGSSGALAALAVLTPGVPVIIPGDVPKPAEPVPPIPIPGSIWLLGSALVGWLVWRLK
jgi:hypothetical protein